MNKLNYDSSSIKTLEPMEHIRKHVGMYLGSKDKAGLLQCVKEIISNCIDEYLNGSGDLVLIKLLPNNGISIEDNGRGIPHGKHQSGCSNLQACVGLINTGGKFDNANQSGYNTSGGQHGVGVKAVNAVSHKFIAKTRRESLEETVEFSKGNFVAYSSQKIDKNITGTYVEFYPDPEVLETTEFDVKAIQTMVKEFSYLCKGLHFILTFADGTNEEYYSKNGLMDYIEYLNSKNTFLTSPIYFEQSEEKYQLEVAIAYNSSYSSNIKLYTNNIPQEKGTHLTGFKTAWTMGLNNFARDNKLLKEKDENLTGSDYEEGLILILNFKMIDPVFKGQNKEELSSSEGRTYVQKLTAEALKTIILTHKQDLITIVNKALNARKAREASRKARDAVRQPKEKGLKAKMAISDKFFDSVDKDPKNRNLLLVEGKSAATSAVEARNVKTDSIYLLRGKIISPLKQSVEKLLANQEISDIIRVIGAGFDKDFDVNKMNFDKIVITSDQDSDGFSIELLLIAFFYTYMRPLVEAGKLYRAITPLYIITQKNQEYYCYSEKDLEDWKATHTGNYDLLRAKGLGELAPATLKEICFDNQRFKRITVSDADATTKLLDILEGPNVNPRKQYIYDNATELGFNFM